MRLARCAAATAGLVVAVLAGSAPAALASNPAVNIFPNPSAPGTSTTFTVNCANQMSPSPATSATLVGTSLGLPTQIPMQASSQQNVFVTTVVLPTSLAPGTFNPEIDCSNGVSASATLQVNAVPSPAPPTGDGATSTTTNGWLTDIGLGLLGVGAVTAGVIVRRHRTGSRT